MEVILKPLQKRYDHINIHYDEIKAIYNLIEDKLGSAKLTTEKFKFDSWGDFEKKYKKCKRAKHHVIKF